MDVRLLVLLFFLVSCMPQSEVSKGNSAQGDVRATGGSDGVATPLPVPTSATSWNFLALNTNSITINVSNLNNAYIVGSAVEKYLGLLNSNVLTNFTNVEYCVVTDFSLGGIKYQLRSRSVPIAYYDFTAKRTVRVYRVDFDDVTNSTASCAGTLQIQDQTGAYVTDVTAPPSPVFSPANLCPSCTNMLTATKVRIFKKELSAIKEIPVPSISLASMTLLVDPNYNASGNAGTCNNTNCKARGFDCCLESQCVKDGATRPSATTTYFSQWQVAEQEKVLNPLAYINYPQIYYVCGTTVPPPTSGGTTTGGSTGGGAVDYNAGFLQLKKDYKCIEQIKSQATATPFHLELMSRSYVGSAECLTAASDAGQTMYFQEVVKRLYSTCGCSQTNLSDMIQSCPAYDYTVTLKDADGGPIRIDCYTPPAVEDLPNVRSVTVNSRSAPHRFFDSVYGLERDIVGSEKTYVTGGVTVEYTQEGEKFEYLDEGGILPNQKDFSMNAILGQMTVGLSNALPAKSIKVDIDQVYLISTVSGYYTPCPQCAKDSWLNTFTAFPSSAMGVGLQAIGHTTQRDLIGSNYTSGNYEDTIFGRACWVPPTMLPYSHSPKTSAPVQRMNRLQTQASLFANGYQRDWYGFNKGALIGSFDGVTWFAIGKGRIVKSTGRKLFLAINAPFADVATPSLHVVQVANYDGVTQAATFDYNPAYHMSHPYQNEAGNCQAYHQCETDTDCITRLGWEYACSDVKDLQTQWPSFDADGKEKTVSTAPVGLDQILQQKRFPSASTKRCIYRGSGAPCLVNSGSITDNQVKRKNLTCAPNFYCAGVNTSAFNSKVSRYAAKLEDIPIAKNHVFGKDANILGRPLNYMPSLAGASLPSGVRQTLIENFSFYEPTHSAANLGLCQPGKKLPTAVAASQSPYEQQKDLDSGRRTDFINQIGSCNSTFYNVARYTSCPTIASDGNYLHAGWANSTPSLLFDVVARSQNSCGLDSLSTDTPSLVATADSLLEYSPFKSIEAKPLNNIATIADPTFARDACFRRAGSVCHTDLDCSPNKYHADRVDYMDIKFFGNEAEQNYNREYLVCGQADAQPSPSDTNAFKNFNMNKNRCCREIGKDLTTYSRDIATNAAGGTYTPTTAGLIVDQVGIRPNAKMRYSRFATVADLGIIASDRPILNANTTRDISGNLTANSNMNISTPKQWNTLSEANSETCCGGGWVRKFSDGTNDWSRNNRLFLDVNNFKCLNSMSVLLTDPDAVTTTHYNGAGDAKNLVSKDYFSYCQDVMQTAAGCAQYNFDNASVENPPLADAYANSYWWIFLMGTWYKYPQLGEITINTLDPSFKKTGGLKNDDFYFPLASADQDAATFIDYQNTSTEARKNISLKIPSFITRAGFDRPILDGELGFINVVYSGGSQSCLKAATVNFTNSKQRDNVDADYCPDTEACCYSYDPGPRILKVIPSATGAAAWSTRRIGVSFTTGGAGGNTKDYQFPTIQRQLPGTAFYYLRRLGWLELSGIPQISYEPLYCSDNAEKLVPGIFKGIKYKHEFDSVNRSFNQDSVKVTTSHSLDFEPVFSANDFKCCAQLGKITDKADKCCSGYGVPFGNGTAVTCKLPKGTDLMVYFNRFVTNEGIDEKGPGGGLRPADFDARTGEPGIIKDIDNKYKIVTSAVDKIRALGNEYCDSKEASKTRQGGVFGAFAPEPAGPGSRQDTPTYTITDSSRDYASLSNGGDTMEVGYNKFMDGFRWNHHVYCND